MSSRPLGAPRERSATVPIYQWTRDESGLILLELSFSRDLLTLETRQHAVVLSDPGVIDRPMLCRMGDGFHSDPPMPKSWRRSALERTRPRRRFRSCPFTEPNAARGGPLRAGCCICCSRTMDSAVCTRCRFIRLPETRPANHPPCITSTTRAGDGAQGTGNAVTPGWFLSNQFAFTGNIWMGVSKR